MATETLQRTSDLLHTELEFIGGSIHDIESQMVMQLRLTTDQLRALLDLHCAYTALRELIQKTQPLFTPKEDVATEADKIIVWPHHAGEW